MLTALDAVPVRTGVSSLEVELPAPWKFDRERGPRPAGLVTDTREDPAQRTLRFELSGTTLKPFELQMEADTGGRGGDRSPREPGKPEPFPPSPSMARASALVRLPRPRGVQTLNRGGHEIVITAPDTIDLRQPQPPNPGMELVDQKPQQARCGAPTANFRRRWRSPGGPTGSNGASTHWPTCSFPARRCDVKQRLSVPAGSAPRADLVLLVPRDLVDRLEVEGAALVEAGPGAGPAQRRVVRWAGKPGDPPPELVLHYRLRRPRNAAGMRTVPLVAVENAPRPAVKVRVWGEPAERLSALEDAWESGPPEVVASEDRLPALV